MGNPGPWDEWWDSSGNGPFDQKGGLKGEWEFIVP